MPSIRLDVAKEIKNPLLIDNLAYKYLEVSSQGIHVKYPAFEKEILERNLYNLLYNSTPIPFKNTWSMRPDYASHDLYGSTIYWPILLYVNRIDTIEEFTQLSEIFYPSIESLVAIAGEITHKTIDANPTNKVSSEVRYYKLYNLDDKEKKKLKASDFLAGLIPDTETAAVELEEVTDVFTLSVTDSTSGFVTLSSKPINFSCLSITLNDDYSPLVFGRDYMLYFIGTEAKVYWIGARVPFGSGPSIPISDGDKLTIIYLTEKTV